MRVERFTSWRDGDAFERLELEGWVEGVAVDGLCAGRDAGTAASVVAP